MTPHERYQRLIDLKGEIKRAIEVIDECGQVRAEKARQLVIATDQNDAAIARLDALHAEAKRLGEEAKADFDALVEPPTPPPTPTPAPTPSPYDEAVRFFNADLEGPRDDVAGVLLR